MVIFQYNIDKFENKHYYIREMMIMQRNIENKSVILRINKTIIHGYTLIKHEIILIKQCYLRIKNR